MEENKPTAEEKLDYLRRVVIRYLKIINDSQSLQWQIRDARKRLIEAVGYVQ